jgi:hypothetical protein
LYSVASVRNYIISLSIDCLIFGMIDLNDTNVMRANKVVLWKQSKRDCIFLK